MTVLQIDPIKTLLVANRGEIASRVFQTARRLGIQTVAVYADEDVLTPFVHDADRAISLSGTSAADTYLNIDKIIDACRQAKVDAVHPGYGFLSENATFARSVLDAGIKWIGPPVEAISQMGDKLTAKALMHNIGVPVLEAIEVTHDVAADDAAKKIGYPILVKASAGGGGRGMRIVEEPDQLIPAIESARRESQAFFASETVFLEKWIHPVRHIEFQILGDRFGNIVHLFERECSIQRRHQKIIEEAPSPSISYDLREQMGQAAVAIAKQLHYESAGTVEFLVSASEFWFLEINTRLQVEHPITEAITFKDLVREQIRIAEGHSLEFDQDDLQIRGHAIEARIYAEEPAAGFLPSPGKITTWKPSSSIRFDSGVVSGSIVNIEFDSMIAKAIAHADTRSLAIAKLQAALESTEIHGVKHNRDFLVEILKNPAFCAGDTTTDFIERVAPALERQYTSFELTLILIACALGGWDERRTYYNRRIPLMPIWKNSYMPAQQVGYKFRDQIILVKYRRLNGTNFEFIVEDEHFKVELRNALNGDISFALDSKHYNYRARQEGSEWHVRDDLGDTTIQELPRFVERNMEACQGSLSAPMPGRILSIEVCEGDEVVQGQLLVILEAMKMEHRITAPTDGTVVSMPVQVGDQVDKDSILVELDSFC